MNAAAQGRIMVRLSRLRYAWLDSGRQGIAWLETRRRRLAWSGQTSPRPDRHVKTPRGCLGKAPTVTATTGSPAKDLAAFARPVTARTGMVRLARFAHRPARLAMRRRVMATLGWSGPARLGSLSPDPSRHGTTLQVRRGLVRHGQDRQATKLFGHADSTTLVKPRLIPDGVGRDCAWLFAPRHGRYRKARRDGGGRGCAVHGGRRPAWPGPTAPVTARRFTSWQASRGKASPRVAHHGRAAPALCEPGHICVRHGRAQQAGDRAHRRRRAPSGWASLGVAGWVSQGSTRQVSSRHGWLSWVSQDSTTQSAARSRRNDVAALGCAGRCGLSQGKAGVERFGSSPKRATWHRKADGAARFCATLGPSRLDAAGAIQ